MTTESTSPKGDTEVRRWDRQYLVTVLLLVGFAALVVAMIWLAGGDDTVWQRRVYVFGAVQAIVFTAIGWLFGREVGRSAAESAHSDAESARDEAKTARALAQQGVHEAAAFKAEVLQAAVRHRLSAGPGTGAARDAGAQGTARTAVDLDAFLADLFGPPERGGH
jgi:hypothetical protein